MKTTRDLLTDFKRENPTLYGQVRQAVLHHVTALSDHDLHLASLAKVASTRQVLLDVIRQLPDSSLKRQLVASPDKAAISIVKNIVESKTPD